MNASITKIAEAIKMYGTENATSANRRLELTALMNQRRASAVDLPMQMKQAHWNVKGPSFIGLHELFDKMAAAVASYVYLITECIVQLGGIADLGYQIMQRIAEVVVKQLQATQQRLLDCIGTNKSSPMTAS